MSADEQWHMAREAAERYERVVARYILGPWAPSLVDAGAVRPGDVVVDLACGTGVVARIAAQRAGKGGRVFGIDLNPGMIAVAAALVPPPGAPVEWLEGSALAIPRPEASADVLLCQQGLQFFPDKALALREMRGVLRPGGRLALSVWSTAGLYNTALAQALARFAGNETAARFHASRKAPGRDELERLVRDAEFSTVTLGIARASIRLPRLDRFALEHLSATPVAAAVAALDEAARKAIGESVMRELQRFADGDGVAYPEETYVVTAIRL